MRRISCHLRSGGSIARPVGDVVNIPFNAACREGGGRNGWLVFLTGSAARSMPHLYKYTAASATQGPAAGQRSGGIAIHATI